jgi:pantetheine-phosphate adenylyltransferase
VAHNPQKKPLFNVKERVDLLRKATADMKGVIVEDFSGLIVEFARQKRINVLIRGVRMISDFEYEFQMALTNRKISPAVETIFLMPQEQYSYISSKLLKEGAQLGAPLNSFVPACVEKSLKKKFAYKNTR